jgi:branched-chain amino acid transport system substrate-binding protein
MPNEAGINAKRLVQENNAPIVYTPHSGGVFALQEFNETDGFLLAAYTSEPQVTDRGNTLTVRIPPRYDGYVEPFSKYAMEKFGKKVALIPGNHAYAKAWTAVFKPKWEELGGEVVAENPMDYNKDTDFYAGVSKSLAENPDVLFVGGASEPTALVIKQARELGFKGGFIVMDQAKMDEMATVLGGYELLEGMIGVIPLTEYGGDAAPGFIEKYEQQHGKIPGSEAAYHYQSLNVFVQAMKEAGTVEDPKAIYAKIGDALTNAPKDKMVYKVTEIGADGGWNSELRIAAVEAMKPVIIEIK